jgi:lipopolysaccharide biosynthesis glycosyltransferase
VNSIYIGFDPREASAFAVARSSLKRHITQPIPVYGLVLDDLQKKGLYTRPMEMRPSAVDKPIMWDVISDAPMSTQHANARFLVKELARTGWALFMDGDVLVRGNVARLFANLKSEYAVYCVKHKHNPSSETKMDGQVQTAYQRKNWSSVMAINCQHPANRELTVEMVNTVPGRDLHRFVWLLDEEIGELGPEWNYLVGHTDPSVDPKIVHFTDGVPDMPTYENVPYADEWREELKRWAA